MDAHLERVEADALARSDRAVAFTVDQLPHHPSLAGPELTERDLQGLRDLTVALGPMLVG